MQDVWMRWDLHQGLPPLSIDPNLHGYPAEAGSHFDKN